MLKNNYFFYLGSNPDKKYFLLQRVSGCLYIQQFIEESLPSEEAEEGEEYVQEWFFPYPEHINLYDCPTRKSSKKFVTASFKPVVQIHCGFSCSGNLATFNYGKARPEKMTRWNNEKNHYTQRVKMLTIT
ncbi:MAG: hypothetical protein ACPGEF_08115 [Endozoicomonas sp.]